jgi:carboxylate-amine ligase
MPDPETAIQAFNGVRPYAPLLEALAANSPFIHGFDSGFDSGRGFQMRRYPRFEVPRAFTDFEDYVTAMECTMAAAEIADHSLVWWRLRLHPSLGTIEIRVMDSQSDLDKVAGLVALTQGLVAAAVDDAAAGEAVTWEALSESSYQAIRFGLDARLWHDGRARPVRELARKAVERARPYAADLGSGEELAAVERILAEGNGSDMQRAAFDRDGIGGVLRFLVEDSCTTTS